MPRKKQEVVTEPVDEPVIEPAVELPVVSKPSKLEVNLGRDDWNLVVNKINELIDFI